MANLTGLKTQINATMEALHSGQIHYGDRVFLNHLLEEFELLTDRVAQGATIMAVGEVAEEMVGSSAELVEDGLDD